MMLALGLMSGTSLDGVDAALIETDGETVASVGAWHTEPYPPALREALRAVIAGTGGRGETERALTDLHASVARRVLAQSDGRAVEVVGFPGHTVRHDPARGVTDQLGDGARLAVALGIDVVGDFRSRDVGAGGQGAPFAPLYHAARAGDLPRPLAVLNLGGVGNVTWIGAEAGTLVAFDTGPGCALIDDWVREKTGAGFDRDGALARRGAVSEGALAALMAAPYFAAPPPKSLDRDDFDPSPIAALDAADGAATLVAFTAAAVARARDYLAAPPLRWLVTGGGRHNPALMAALAQRLAAPVDPVEAVGWRGDALEAEAFGFLAVRSLRGLPLSLPSTTGVPAPTTGGVLHRA